MSRWGDTCIVQPVNDPQKNFCSCPVCGLCWPFCVSLSVRLSPSLSLSPTLCLVLCRSVSFLPFSLFLTETWVTTRYQSWLQTPSKVCAPSTLCEYCVMRLYSRCSLHKTSRNNPLNIWGGMSDIWSLSEMQNTSELTGQNAQAVRQLDRFPTRQSLSLVIQTTF